MWPFKKKYPPYIQRQLPDKMVKPPEVRAQEYLEQYRKAREDYLCADYHSKGNYGIPIGILKLFGED